MTSGIDLHAHSNESDGELSINHLIDLALISGVKVLAITDHETVNGCEKAFNYAKNKDIEIVTGIEIGCDEKDLGFYDVHILGLFIDYKNKNLLGFCENTRNARIIEKKQMIKKLQSLGFDITFKEVENMVGYSFGRPHIAQALVKKYPEEFKNTASVFDRYIGNGKPAYIGRSRPSIKDAIKLIKNANGIPILAHPGVFKKEDVIALIRYFVACGGEGIEAYYRYDLILKPDLHAKITKKDSEVLNKSFRRLAEKHKLVASGGSDFHGKIRKTVDLGTCTLPDHLFKKLKHKAGLI